MSGVMRREKAPGRNRSSTNRKWQRGEEEALINFIKKNRDFEKPCARVYYTKFLFESGLDVDWQLVRSKVRNMRTAYRRAKEQEFNKIEAKNCNAEIEKNKIFKSCWYEDHFNILFPNEMDNYVNNCSDPIFDDEFYKDESFSNADNASINFFYEEESTRNSISKTIGGDMVERKTFEIKKKKRDEDTNIKEQESELAIEKSNCEKEHIRLKEVETRQTSFRNRPDPIRKWQRNEEVAIIDFLKQNRDFEKPTARIYYTRFIFENGIDIDWKRVRSKVRNMRTAYRKAKEHEISNAESNNCNVQVLKNQILKICWYADDFDILFSNEMDNSIKYSDSIFDDEFSKDESFSNIDSSSKSFNNKVFHEDESTTSSLCKSMDANTTEKEKRDENTSIKRQEQIPFRNRLTPVRKWKRKEEVAVIVFLKQNRDFEKPNARMYYTKFIGESGMDIDWQRVRSKVRNMRVAYQKAKEHEINNAESTNCNIRDLRNQILKICWYVDDFDILFPNEMDSSIYQQPDPSLDDEFSNDDVFDNVHISSKNVLLEEDSTTSSFSKSLDGDIFTVQKNLFNLKKQQRGADSTIKQEELKLAKEKLSFQKEKFCQEIRLKEKEIDVEERLKTMELQMKERIAIKELEIEEKLALGTIERPKNVNCNVYHSLI